MTTIEMEKRPSRRASATWSPSRGARMGARNGVHFSVWAPKAKRMDVVLYGEGGEHVVPLERGEGDVFEATVAEARPGTDYRFRLDGGEPRPDPASRWQPEGVHGPSRVVDPSAFEWTDAAWKGLEIADYVIYEMHVGTFTADGTFDAAIERLAALRELGVTVIEVMPVAEFPGARNWGYDGVALYAPHSAYGGPEAFRRFVNAAHEAGLGVILDVVYNHFGPEGNYLPLYGPYLTDIYRTPWGSAVNYDGADSTEVRRFVIENAMYWVHDFHVDGLRLDAIHGIYDFGAKHVLAELVEQVHELAGTVGRTVQVIAESDLNDPRVVRPPRVGGLGFDGQWSDDFHHAVHALLTGEDRGYYADFGGVDDLARAIAERFVYDGRYSAHRKRHHGAPGPDVSNDHFVICIQNHDQVGNRAAGERLSVLVPFAKQKLAAALMLLSPYVPLLFMGEEWGETNPFQYFVSHGDEELVDAVRKGRKDEFKAFGWGDDVPDPQSEETFGRSKLDWAKPEQSPHRELRALYRDLLALRKREPALRPGIARVGVQHDKQRTWITVELTPDAGHPLAVLCNLADAEQDVPLPAAHAARWSAVLTTEDDAYRAGGTAGASERDTSRSAVTLSPHSAALFRLEHL